MPSHGKPQDPSKKPAQQTSDMRSSVSDKPKGGHAKSPKKDDDGKDSGAGK